MPDMCSHAIDAAFWYGVNAGASVVLIIVCIGALISIKKLLK